MEHSSRLHDATYHLVLWVGNVALFLLLDFAKRLDDLLYGLSAADLAVNAGVVVLLSWPLCLGLSGLGLLLERFGGSRASHFLAVWAFVTVNLWSLKVGFAATLENIKPDIRLALAVLLGGLALLATLAITVRLPRRIAWLDSRRAGILIAWAVLPGFALGGALLGKAQPPSIAPTSDKPSVILVTIDALSAQHCSFMGYSRNTTPELARLAEQSVMLQRMHSNFNVTGLALPSFNGYLSSQPEGQTLAQGLAAGGYPNTAFFGIWAPELFFLHGFSHCALTRSGMLSPVYRFLQGRFTEPRLRWLAGLASEEPRYFNPYSAEYHDDIFWQSQHYPPRVSLQQALEYLERNPRGAFVWVHLWPPHFPYVPDPDTRGMFGPEPEFMRPWVNVAHGEVEDGYVAELKNLYDASVFSTDREVGWFLERLKESGLYDTSYLVVSADHGESFSRGYLGHSGWPLMESITHIPLLLRRPGQREQVRVQTFAQQLDLAPTMLDLLGLPIPKEMRGESLRPYIEQPDKLSQRYKISISLMAYGGEGGQLAVYWNTFKLMFLSNDRQTFRLYDLFKDPLATQDISSRHPDLVREMMSRVGTPKR